MAVYAVATTETKNPRLMALDAMGAFFPHDAITGLHLAFLFKTKKEAWKALRAYQKDAKKYGAVRKLEIVRIKLEATS